MARHPDPVKREKILNSAIALFLKKGYRDATVAEIAGNAGLVASNAYIYFEDAGEISDYAREAVMLLYRAGIINGKGDGIFDPQGSATRAELAAMLHRFLEAAGFEL